MSSATRIGAGRAGDISSITSIKRSERPLNELRVRLGGPAAQETVRTTLCFVEERAPNGRLADPVRPFEEESCRRGGHIVEETRPECELFLPPDDRRHRSTLPIGTASARSDAR